MFRLEPTQSRALGRVQQQAEASGNRLDGLAPFRLGVASASSFHFITDCLPAAALRHGLALQTTVAEFGQVAQSVFDPASPLLAAGCDAILLAVDHRWLGFTGPDRGGQSVSDALAQIEALASALSSRHGVTPILQSLPTPFDISYGNQDGRFSETLRAQVAAFNASLSEVAAKTGAVILDTERLAALVGTARWFNPVPSLNYKAPFDMSCAPLYADWLARLIAALRGTTAKCLVLDLDNTLWGGVVGDGGVAGIVIGQGTPRGEAHLALQQVAKGLRERGIFLAIASKNDDPNARAPFREHNEMVLSERDISVFQANWTDKAANLKAIAATLNIGVDALVFVDDNPAERELIKRELPLVRVLELPDDPAWFAWIVQASGWFETISVTSEDRTRASMQAADAERARALDKTDGLDDYLASLEMTAKVEAFMPSNRQRVTQLINKTNQFNLRTKRYTEQEVARLENGLDVLALCLRLSDRFGDLGIVAVTICRADTPTHWYIDSLLMSCRVLGRGVEGALISTVAKALRARGVEMLTGAYIPTAKNAMVADLLERLGFTALGNGQAFLDLTKSVPNRSAIRVEAEIK